MDGNNIAPHAPDLYAGESFTEGISGFGAAGAAEMAQYREQGLLVIRDAFSTEEVQAAKAGLLDLVMGRVSDFHDIEFEAKAASRLSSLSAEEQQDAVQKLMWFAGHEPRLNALASHPALMALLKPPQIGREKPWHQEHAYFDYPQGTPIAGDWIALDEATTENGCMFFQLGGHRGGVIPHLNRRDWQICDIDVRGKTCVAVPLKPGGLLFFDGLLPHGTPTNHSGLRRRAVQFHCASQSASKCATGERVAAFGSDRQERFLLEE